MTNHYGNIHHPTGKTGGALKGPSQDYVGGYDCVVDALDCPRNGDLDSSIWRVPLEPFDFGRGPIDHNEWKSQRHCIELERVVLPRESSRLGHDTLDILAVAHRWIDYWR